jgi:hypothetical protein
MASYIKELADRLNTLENHVQHTQAGFDFTAVGEPGLEEAQAPAQFPRKRTHSMSEGFQDAYNRSNWPAQDRGIHHTYVTEMLSPLTYQEQPLNGAANSNRRISFGDMTLAGNLITGSNELAIKAYAYTRSQTNPRLPGGLSAKGISESKGKSRNALTDGRYYQNIHPTLPLLPQGSPSLNRLSHCPPKLREAFFLTLECSVRSFAPRALPHGEVSVNQLIHQCYEAVDAAKLVLSDADSSQHFFNNLVYCQSLLFLTVASDRPAPGTIGSTAELLGRLAGRISDVGINDAKILAALREQDMEMYEAARRVFWVAYILDRFHATSRSKDIKMPLHSGSVTRADFSTLGEAGYHLARKLW